MPPTAWSRSGLPLLRITWGLVTVAALVATYGVSAAAAPVNPFNFFGYFTIQSNLLLAVTALIAGAAGLRRAGTQSRWLVALRALATVCMIVVGFVYVTLLLPLGAAGGVPLPWANLVMHVLGPILVILDWGLSRDRRPLPWRMSLLQLIYPLAWTAVVLVRGATDGWVPYPFLDPAQGYGAVAVTVALIAVVFFACSAAVVWWSRKRP